MKEALVNVPVAIHAFIRPKMLEKQWAVIKEARPSVLIIRSDGPRASVPSDKEKIAECRKIVEDIDWECDVHKLYFEENQGMYNMIDISYEYIWSRFDRCIFLEDDQIPSVSYFKYCEYLLEKYKDDLRIHCIHGVNLCEKWDKTDADYFFAKVPVSSGKATWKRSFEMCENVLDYKDNAYVSNLMYKTMPKYMKKQFKSFAETGTYANHRPGGEFFVRYAEICQNQLVIIPKYNLINNIGVGEGSTHTANNIKAMPKKLQKMYDMKTYEYEFPLKDAEFVIADVDFEKEREKQLGVYSPLQKAARFISRSVRLVLFGEGKRLIKGITKRLRGNLEQ